MSDDSEVLDFLRNDRLAGITGRGPKEKSKDKEAEEESCSAFGFLRGLDARGLMVEFRFANGNSIWFPYSWLGPWQYNPSVGILLKFTGDVVTLVLIRGSNLDVLVNEQSVNLTDRGFQRHRITFVREMDKEELKKAGEGAPTVDRIEIEEFESHEELREWLKKAAPAFNLPTT